MIYKNFGGEKISALGMGGMRLPTSSDGSIDKQMTDSMVDYALSKGINFFDTGYGYHKGTSESILSESLRRYPRENYFFATKFPGYDSTNWNNVKKIFNEQLTKTCLEYFDFYLIHNVCDINIDAYLDDDKYHIVSFLYEQKQKGLIKHLGFSAHGDVNVIERFISKYGNIMEFCYLQVNYLDWDFQKAKDKIEL